ncbi:hypothetical protein [Rhizobium sp. T136]|nr:hypothetical protein [Rhizobium sp. T136]
MQHFATGHTLGLAVAPGEFDCVRGGIDVAWDGSREALSSGA